MKHNTIYNKIFPIVLMVVTVFNNFAFYIPTAYADINKQINYQGKLTDSSNTPVADDGYEMEFKLYTSLSGGTAIWTETRNGTNLVSVKNGLFSVMLGSTTPLTGVDFNQTLYLGVNIEGDGEMTPRKIIGAVPASFVADTLDNVSSEQFLRSDAQNATSSSNTFINVLQTGAGKIAEFFGQGSASVLSVLSNGNVGVGTTSPYSRLSVEGSAVVGGSIRTSNIIATSTASSTFAGPIVNSSTATSTWANGINLSAGCFSVNNTCLANNNYGDENVNSYIHSSTTIAKLYSSNTFTGNQTFDGSNIFGGSATFNSSVSIGSLNGPLQANNGVVSATTSIGTVYGGTGINSYTTGDILYASGNNTLSKLAVGTPGYVLAVLNGVPTWVATTTLSTISGLLNLTNQVTGVLPVANGGTGQSSFGQGWLNSNGSTITSSTSPTVAYITATSTASSTFAGPIVNSSTATSTWANGINLSAGCFAINNTCLANNTYGNTDVNSFIHSSSTIAKLYSNNIFTGANIFSASTTIGNGTQTGGLTISGGATTTGNAYFAGNVGIGTTSPYSKLSVEGDAVVGGSIRTSNIISTSSTASVFTYASTTGLTASSRFWGANLTDCTTGSKLTWTAGQFGCDIDATGGGTGGGSWSTTTSQVAGVDVNFSNNSSDVVAIGGNSTTTAEYWFDPNTSTASLAGNVTVGNLLSATTLNLTNALGIAFGGTGLSSTPTYGQLLLGNSSGGYSLTATSSLGLSSFAYPFINNSTSSLLSFTGGLISSASTTIGNGTQTGGLTISGGATTTGIAYFAGNVGIGTTSPGSSLSIKAAPQTNSSLFTISSSSDAYPFIDINNRGSFVQKHATNPVAIGSYNTTGQAIWVQVVGKYAYVSDYTSGLQIIDVSSTTNPVLLSTFDTPGQVNRTFVLGKYAYVSDYGGGIIILDITNPRSPVQIGSYSGLTSTQSIYLSGKYLYVANEASGLSILDVSDPSNPTHVGTIDTTNAQGVTVVGKYAYVGDGTSGLQVIDVSDPSSPYIVGNYNTAGTAYFAHVDGRYAYMADGTGGIQIVDISNPASPRAVSSLALGGIATTISVNGRYAYLGDTSSGFTVVDISNPTIPRLVGKYANGEHVYGISIVGKYAYIANRTTGLVILDLGGIETPNLYAGNINASGLNVDYDAYFGNSLYVQNGINVGRGGLYSEGGIFSYVASSTLLNPVAASFIGGNVGVGTTSPYSRLSVNGNGVITGSLTVSNIISTSTATSTFAGPIVNSSTATSTWANGINLSAGCFAINNTCLVNNTYGDTNVNSFIHSSTTIAKLYSNNIFTGANIFSASTTIGNGTQTGGLTISGGATTTGNAYFAGNVGIGTTSPYGTFSLQMPSTYTSGATAFVVDGGGSSLVNVGSNIVLKAGTGIDSGGSVSILGGTGSGDSGSAGGDISIRAGTGAFLGTAGKLYLDGGINTGGNNPGSILIGTVTLGNVGIGTTSPYAKLSVAGSAVVGGSIRTSNIIATSTASSTFAGPIVNSSTATSTWANGINLTAGCFAINNTCVGAGSGVVGSGTAGQLPYYASNGTTLTSTSTIFIGTNGNVGIGTAVPSNGYKLDVNGNIRSTNGIQSDSGGIITLNSATAGGVVGIENVVTGTAISAIDDIVGVQNQIVPSTTLANVAGAYGTMNQIIRSGSSNTLSNIYGTHNDIDNSAGTATNAYGDYVTITNSGTLTNAYGFYADTIQGTNAYAVYTAGTTKSYFGGNVGVGTTSPYAKLSVAGDVVVGGSFRTSNIISTSTVASSFAGNLGIATTSPSERLSVNGNGVITGSLRTSNIISTSTASSTFAGPIVNSSTATSTWANGIDLTAGCFAINGTCLGGGSGGSGTVGSGTAGQFGYYASSGTTLTATSTLFLTTAGTIGIGTTSTMANAKILVAGGLGISSSNGAVVVGNTTGNSRGTDSLEIQSSRTLASQVASGLRSIIFGTNNTTSGDDSISIGSTNIVSSNFAIALGRSNTVSTLDESIAVGSWNDVSGEASSVFGYGNVATGTQANAFGYNNDAIADNASVFGNNIINYLANTVMIGPSDSAKLTVNSSGYLGLGTTSPYARLSVAGNVVADTYFATSTTATSTFAGGLDVGGGNLSYDFSTGVTSISSLQTGNINFDTDAGAVSWVDMEVTSASPSGVTQRYTAFLDSNPMLTIYGISNGSGDVTNLGVGIATTSPYQRLSVNGSAVITGSILTSFITATSTATSTFGGPLVNSSTATSTWANGINLSAGCFAINNVCAGTGTVGAGTIGQLAFYNANGTAIIGTSDIFLSGGNVGIGTTSPYAKLSVVGPVVAEYFHATSTTATSTFAGGLDVGGGNLSYDFSTGVTSISSLQTGNMSFDTDAGLVSWTDLPLSSASDGTPQGYTAFLNGSSTISVYGVSAGSGWLQNDYPRVSIGQTAAGTTTPTSKLTIFGNGIGTGGIFELVNSASTTLVKVLDNGSFGIGTTSPYQRLSVNGDAVVTGSLRTSNIIATSTTASSTFAGPIVNSSTATSTWANGINLSAGCFSINNTCLANNTYGNTDVNSFIHSSTTIAKLYSNNIFTGANIFSASTTIGNGTQTGGLTISGGATTTGNAYFAGNIGVGTTSATATLEVKGRNSVSGAAPYALAVYGGTSGNGSHGGGIYMRGGDSGLGIAGGLTFVGGNSTDIGAGGGVSISAGDALTSGSSGGGSISLTAGSAGSLSSAGSITLTAGSAGANGSGGNITLSPGAITGVYQSVNLAPIGGNVGIGTTSPYAKLSITGTASAATSSTIFAIASSTNLASAYVSINSRGSATFNGSAIDPQFVAETRGTTPGTTLDGAYDVFVSGKYAYVANYTRDSLAVIDISNPANPTFIAETQGTTPGTTLDGASSVFVSGKYVYVTNYTRDSLAVIDISNPANPTFIAETQGTTPGTTLNGATSVFVSGKYAYVASNIRDSLAVIDISNPANPTFIAETQGTTPGTTLNGASSVFISGKYAYVANLSRDSLAVIDISNPANPTFIAETQGPTPGTSLDGAFSVFVSGKYAYVANNVRDSLAVIDISNPTNPTFIAETRGPIPGTSLDAATKLFVSGKYAYVANYGRDSLAVIDISNPANPTFIAETQGTTPGTTLDGASTVFVSGKYAYVANNTRDSLAVIDIGGIEASTLYAGNIGTDNLQVDALAQFGQSVSIEGGLNVGVGGIYSNGGIFSYVASTTATNPVSAAFMGGNVGVGTTSPYSRLSVDGNGVITGSLTVSNIISTSTATSTFAGGLLVDSGTLTVDYSTNNVGIGTLSPIARLDIRGTTSLDSSVYATRFADSSFAPDFVVRKARGTESSPTIVQVGDRVGSFASQAYDGTAFRDVALMLAEIDGTPGVSDTPGRLTFYTTPDGSTTAMERMRITNAGNVGIGTTSPYAKLSVAGDVVVGGSFTTSNIISTSTATSTFAGSLEVGGYVYSAGLNWTTSSSTELNSWNSVTYGNGLFVAVSSSGANRVMTSPDGINWTARSASEATTWESVTYGNGLFVAVALSGTNRVMTSPDGINWTSRSAAEANQWYSVTYGNGLFVAVAGTGSNRIMTSPDGINWTARTATEANTWTSVTYGNGQFVAVAYDGTNRVMTSPDGITWTARSASEANQWYSVVYGNGVFVAVSQNGTNRVMTSRDGITWTARSASEANEWTSVSYGNGLFVAVSQSGTNRVMTSPDGITWTARSASEANFWFDITYGNGMFVAVSYTGTNRVMYSGKPNQTRLATNNTYQGGMNIFGSVGLGTSTPWGLLSINQASSSNPFGPGFVIASSTRTDFIVTNTGNVGIGTTSPYAKLSITGTPDAATSSTLFAIASSTNLASAYVSINSRGSATFNGSAIDPQYIAETQGTTPGTTLDGATSVFVSGKYAYVANNTRDSFAVIDISNPASPTFIAETQGPTPGTSLDGAIDVFVSGKYAYVANQTRDSLAVIDISNPANPTFIAETQGTTPGTTLNAASSVFVSGKYAYVANGTRDSLAVIDISNPANPTFIAETQGPTPGTSLDGAIDVFVSGKYAYVANQLRDSLAVIDISNPANPTFIAETQGTTPGTTLNTASSVFVSGKYAYVANQGRDSFAVIDISNPASPTFIAETLGTTPGTTLNAASSVFVSGKYAYVANNLRDSLAVIDISNPANPTFIAETQGTTPGTTLNGARGVFVSSKYAYLVNNARDSLAVIDIGGLEASTLYAGNIGTDNLQVDAHAQFGQSVSIEGGLNVGVGGIYSNGGIFSYVASSTVTNPVSAAFMGGNVGVGTTSPYARLSVDGNGVITGSLTVSNIISTSTATSTFAGSIGIGTTTPGTVLNIYNNGVSTTLGQLSNNLRLTNPQNIVANAGNEISFQGLGNVLETGIYASISAPITSAATSGSQGYLSFNTKSAAADTSLTERMRITATGNVGIGTSTPLGKLSVEDSAGSGFSTLVKCTSTSGACQNEYMLDNGLGLNTILYGSTYSFGSRFAVGKGGIATFYDNPNGQYALGSSVDAKISFWQNNLERITIASSTATGSYAGNVGIASTTPWRKLSVNGTVGFSGLTNDGTGNYVCISGSNEITYSATACVGSSSGFVKHDITSLDNTALTQINALRPVSYKYNSEVAPNDDTTHLGFIAEEVNQINPNLVAFDQTGKPKSVKYDEFTPLLAKAIQEQQVQINGISSTTEILSQENARNAIASSSIELINTNLASTTQTTRSLASALDITNMKLNDLSQRLDILTASGTTTSVFDEINTMKDQLAGLSIDSLASSTADTLASSTPSFIERVAIAVKEMISEAGDWVVAKISATLAVFDKVETKELCVGETCVTEEQLKALLSNANVSTANNNSENATSTGPLVIPKSVVGNVAEENNGGNNNSTSTPEVVVEDDSNMNENATSTPVVSEETNTNEETTGGTAVEETPAETQGEAVAQPDVVEDVPTEESVTQSSIESSGETNI